VTLDKPFQIQERLSAENPNVPIGFFEDCVPEEGLTLNEIFIKNLTVSLRRFFLFDFMPECSISFVRGGQG
jgi:hypothetical protein